MTSRSLLLDDLAARHLVNQMTAESELRSHLAEGARTLYCGFDPTADSLHIGSLVPLLALRRFQLFGHKPIALVGGATGLIGDPSFKTEERRLNTPDIVAGWVHKIESQLSRFIDFDAGSCSAKVVNNLDWVGGLDVLTFLRDIGKHFSVNAMIQKESVKQRIEREGDGISYTEFTYMILQAFDYAELHRRHQCTLQIGGSDQWGNITAGTDLTRRLHHVHVHGLTLPLVTKSDGTKFGKTETGTVWLDPVKTSPYAFYQFWINTADADAYRFLRYFTFLQPAEIDAIERVDQASEGRKSAQSILARQVTELVHGVDGVAASERISHALFSGDIGALTEKDFQQLALDGMPCTRLLADEKLLVEILVETGLALTPRGDATIGQARKFIQQQAVVVNNDKVLDTELMLMRSHALFGQFHLLRRGKKNFHLLVWV